jgi:hypothetical protein
LHAQAAREQVTPENREIFPPSLVKRFQEENLGNRQYIKEDHQGFRKSKKEDGEMKKKALVMALLCVMGLTAISIGTAEAGAWYTCTISQVGATNWGNWVILTDTATTPAFTNVMFLIDASTVPKEMFATSLSAWANSNDVLVYVSGITTYSTVFGIFAIK